VDQGRGRDVLQLRPSWRSGTICCGWIKSRLVPALGRNDNDICHFSYAGASCFVANLADVVAPLILMRGR